MTTEPPRGIAHVRDLAREIAARMYARWPAHQREDLVQTVWCKYWERWGEGGGPENVEAWLTTVTRNAANDLNDAERRHADRAAAPGENGDPIDLLFALAAPEFASMGVVTDALIEAVLGLLPTRPREIVRARYLLGLSSAEVGQQLGLQPAAVDTAAARAKAELRAAMVARPDLMAELRLAHPRLH